MSLDTHRGNPAPAVKGNHPWSRSGVPVEPLREAFLRSGRTATEVALDLGWMHHGRADGHRVRQALGLARYSVGGRRKRLVLRKHLTPGMAERLCGPLGVWPVDIGL